MSDVFSDDSEEVAIDIEGDDYTPPDVDTLRVAINGRVMTLEWEADAEQSDGYELRFSPLTAGAQWATMSRLAYDVRGSSYQTMVRDGTFAVKALGYGGTPSSGATMAVVTGTELVGVNVVATVSETGTWSGVKSSTVVVDGELRLVDGANVFATADAFALADVFSPGGQIVYAGEGYYVLPGTFDLGAVYTSRVTPSVIARGFAKGVDLFAIDDVFSFADVFGFDAGDFNVRMDIQTTQADPALGLFSTWTELRPGDVTARAMKFRLALQSLDAGVTPSVASASVLIDMPDRQVSGNDIVAGAAGTAIAFSPAFKATPAIQITAQDLATGDYWRITAKSAAGFTIQFFNASNAGISRTFDYTAKGYGVSR